MLGVRLLIDNVDRTSFLKTNTLQFSDKLEGRGTCGFTLVATTKPYYRPQVGEVVELLQEETTVYKGTIEDFTEREPGLRDVAMFFAVSAVDFSQKMDRFVVAKIYDGDLAGDIIKDMIDIFVNSVGESIGIGGVQDGLLIERVVFGYRKVSDCLRDLSKLIGFSWYVDFNEVLNFFDRTTFAAPFGLSSGSDNFRKLKIKRKRSQYRNIEYIRAGEDLTDPQTEEFAGDDERQTFTLAFEAGDEPTIKVNAVAKTIGIRGEDDETAFDWFWRKADKEVTQKKTDTPLATTDVLQVVYQGLFPIVAIAEDVAQIADRSSIEGGSGIYEHVIDDDSIETREFALQKAEGVLRRFGDIPEIIGFETDSGGLRSGMLMPVLLPDHDLDGDFLIDSVRARIVEEAGGRFFRYTVKGLSGEHLGSWVDFYRSLQNAGRTFKLREGETLTLIRKELEDVILNESFNKTDPLGALDDDPYTGAQFGTITGSVTRGTWGESITDPTLTTYGSQIQNPPVDS